MKIIKPKISKEDLSNDIEKYISVNYKEPVIYTGPILFQMSPNEKELLAMLDFSPKTFRDKLFEMIKEKKLHEVKVYKKAHISRQLFSKIRSDDNYHPERDTVFALAIGMELSVEETNQLLYKAGYIFTDDNKRDVIIQYFLSKQIYDIFLINEVLDKYGFSTI